MSADFSFPQLYGPLIEIYDIELGGSTGRTESLQRNRDICKDIIAEAACGCTVVMTLQVNWRENTSPARAIGL